MRKQWGAPILFAVWAAVGVGIFMWAAQRTYGLGFPLDDAWIHQTYARNLVQWGQWAYRRGTPSAGVTAPLWVLLQAVGQAAGVPPVAWSAVLGWAALTALGYSAWAWWRRYMPGYGGWWPWLVGFSVSGAWHLVWAALSGMETALFALVMTLVVLWGGSAWRQRWGGVFFGLAIGGAVWLRPEAVLALPVLALVWLLEAACQAGEGARRRFWKAAVQVAALGGGFLVAFLPYLGFNFWLSGHIWPNTFYAKQAEYAVLRQLPLWARLWRVSVPLMAGMGGVLFPFALWQVGVAGRQRRWAWLAAPAWAGLHLMVYAVRLPVAYQHGRYVLPVLPVVLVWGWQGVASLWKPWKGRLTAGWALSRTAVAGAVLAGVFFFGMGARVYARDVAFIESEMVATARWMHGHLPPGTLVAAHDIGAVGYFTDFPLVDMAGLVSPQVIPFVRDEQALCVFLNRQDVQVLVAFPDWYEHLTEGLPRLYANPKGWGPRLGGTHMTVFAWKRSCAILWAWP